MIIIMRFEFVCGKKLSFELNLILFGDFHSFHVPWLSPEGHVDRGLTVLLKSFILIKTLIIERSRSKSKQHLSMT